MAEVRDCPSFIGYAAGDNGRVYSRWVRAKGQGRNAFRVEPTALRELRPISYRGYLYATVSHLRRPIGIHRLVMDAFAGPCPTGQLVRHLDGDGCNNRRQNLAYGTPAENGADKRRLHEAARGEANGRARLTAAAVVDIRRRRAAGESIASMARALGLRKQTLYAAVSGQNWKWL